VKQKVVFVDRDDTLIRTGYQGYWYITAPNQVQFFTGVLEGLKRLRDAAVPVFCVTTQNCVPKGVITKEELVAIHDAILYRVDAALSSMVDIGVVFGDAVIGKTELIKWQQNIQNMLAVDEVEYWMIGDLPTDIEAGAATGCKTIHLWYPETEFHIAVNGDPEIAKKHSWDRRPKTSADYEVSGFLEAVEIILREEGRDGL